MSPLERRSEEFTRISSGAQVVIEYTTFLFPQFWRTAVSHEPKKLRQHPSPKGMASVERGKWYIGVGVARLAVLSEEHSDSIYPSPHHTMQSHIQVRIIDLCMPLSRHHGGIHGVLLRLVTAPV